MEKYSIREWEAETGRENGVEKERREGARRPIERREGAPRRGSPEERGEIMRAPLPLTLSLPTKARVACPISHFSPTDTYTDIIAAAAANPVYPHARASAPMCASACGSTVVNRSTRAFVPMENAICSIDMKERERKRDRMARAG